MSSSTSLTDDILIEIFTYFPLNSIYKFKCLSKVWLSNLSSPNFITKWFRINNESLPWIHYHTICNRNNPLSFRNAYPVSHSEFMSRYEHLFSFEFLRNQKPFQGARLYLLGSSNGLVLCCSFGKYHACNPLTQKWVTLPSPPRSEASPLGVNGIFCDYSPSLANCYKVVRIPAFNKPSKRIIVDIFCSDLGVWESNEVSCDEHFVGELSIPNNVVILDGVLYWNGKRRKMLVCNLNQKDGNDGCSLINLPYEAFGSDDESTYYTGHIGESEGWVCYAETRFTERGMTVSVWVLHEVNWQILHKNVSIDNILAELRSRTSEFSRLQVLGFSPMDRNVVLLGRHHWVWRFNIQTRSLEELCLHNKHVYHSGWMCMPFALKPMPTVLPPPSWIDT